MEKPILFSGDMAKAILLGNKTQTRRVVKPLGKAAGFFITSNMDGSGKWPVAYDEHEREYDNPMSCPYGEPGDTLWVRETWLKNAPGGVSKYFYKADAPLEVMQQARAFGYKWRPSIHMPREAARLFLTVKDVRVERLREITEDDARAEGVETLYSSYRIYGEDGAWTTSPVRSFQTLWDGINAKRGYGWDVNPWVWVVEFEKQQ